MECLFQKNSIHRSLLNECNNPSRSFTPSSLQYSLGARDLTPQRLKALRGAPRQRPILQLHPAHQATPPAPDNKAREACRYADR